MWVLGLFAILGWVAAEEEGVWQQMLRMGNDRAGAADLLHANVHSWDQALQARRRSVDSDAAVYPAWKGGERFTVWVFMSVEDAAVDLETSPRPKADWFTFEKDAVEDGGAVLAADVSHLQERLEETVEMAQASFIARGVGMLRQFLSNTLNWISLLGGTGDGEVDEDSTGTETGALESEKLPIWEGLLTSNFQLLWKLENLQLESDVTAGGVFRTNVSLPDRVWKHNESVYLHIVAERVPQQAFGGPPGFEERDAATFAYTIFPLVEYRPKKKVRKLRHLLGDGSTKNQEDFEVEDEEEEEVEEDTSSLVGWWRPELTIGIVRDAAAFKMNAIPPQIMDSLDVVSLRRKRRVAEGWDEIDNGIDGRIPRGTSKAVVTYRPLLWVNDFWLLKSNMLPLPTNQSTNLPLSLRFETESFFYWTTLRQMDSTMKRQAMLAGTRNGADDQIKRILLESNPVLLGVTMVVSLLHSVFEFLAFRNEVAFWRSAKSMEGLSLRSLAVNLGFSIVIFLYLWDNETSWMILIQQAIGIVIELWKLRKAVGLSLLWTDQQPENPKEENLANYISRLLFQNVFGSSKFPKLNYKDRDSYVKSKTREYDQVAMTHLMYISFPLLIGYSLYSLIYDQHRGIISWLLGSLVGFIYVFGFITMTPQLFINYKLKSTAHLPWKAMTFKFLNTIVDDLFAFVMPMPILHRLACFRDDIIFLIYLYQRQIYPVDPNRVNEYGASMTDYTLAESLAKGERRQPKRSKFHRRN